MSEINIPPKVWKGFLETFSERHAGWLVQVETHDTQTDEMLLRVSDPRLPVWRCEAFWLRARTQRAWTPRIYEYQDRLHRCLAINDWRSHEETITRQAAH